MRSLALFLLLVNVVFLTWQMGKLPWAPWQPEEFRPPLPQSRAVPADLPLLVLLNERKSGTESAVPSDEKTSSPITPTMASVETGKKNSLSEETPPIVVANSTEPSHKTTTSSANNVTNGNISVNVQDKTETPTNNKVPESVANQNIAKTEIKSKLTEGTAIAVNSSDPKLEGKTSEEKAPPHLTAKPPTEASSNAAVPVPTITKETTTQDTQLTANSLPDLQHLAEAMTPTKKFMEAVVKTSEPSKVETVSKLSEKSEKNAPVTPTEVSVPAKPSKSGKPDDKAATNVIAKKKLAKVASACYKTGPFVQINSAKMVAEWFKGKPNIVTNVQKRATAVLESTRIYMVFPNRQAALDAQKRLQQAGIMGHELVSGGKLNHAIFLGTYHDPRNVFNRLAELRAKGYKNLKTEEHYKSDTRYWLNVKIPKGQSELLNAFKQHFKSTMTLTLVGCE